MPAADLDWLAEALKRPPGESAQYRMAPRLRRQEVALAPDPASARPSAVLVALFPETDQWHTIFIERGIYDGVHSGQIALPGGRMEPQDHTAEDTALREAEEEVALPRSAVRVLGRLTELYIPASGHVIQPVVGMVNERPELRPEPREVASVITVPLNRLFAPQSKDRRTRVVRGGFRLEAPHYLVDQHEIWGATAMIISELEHLFELAL